MYISFTVSMSDLSSKTSIVYFCVIIILHTPKQVYLNKSAVIRETAKVFFPVRYLAKVLKVICLCLSQEQGLEEIDVDQDPCSRSLELEEKDQFLQRRVLLELELHDEKVNSACKI